MLFPRNALGPQACFFAAMENTKVKKARPKGTLTFSGNVPNMGKIIMKIAFY
jgi:hypothetical protein